ncbi:hypothetical protein JCM18899A_31170 [Nocardioides sp. AN3]
MGHLGWGAILPYQYVYASQARGWGQLVAALAAGLFSVGSLVGSPLFGRVADGRRPERVLMAAQAFAAAACLGLLASGSPPWFCLSSLIFGLGMMGAAPAKSVLVLHWTPAAAHRRVFAYRFAGESIGMASGAVVSGLLVDVTHPDGMTPAYVIGALSLSTALAVSAWAAHRAPERMADREQHTVHVSMVRSLRLLSAHRTLCWLAVLTTCLALAFYAQFEAGLPAYAVTELHAGQTAIGLAAATNCATIAAFQMVMLRITDRQAPGPLLVVVGLIWVACWTLLGAAAVLPVSWGAVIFVATYGVFALGETIFTPILSPLVARLAPAGIVGTALGVFGGLQTMFSALGPLIAAVSFGLGLPVLFVGVHLALSMVAVLAAGRLAVLLSVRSAPLTLGPSPVPRGCACSPQLTSMMDGSNRSTAD